ncbi:MAG TPA: HAD family hydrolase [Anaerolineae bacterium]|nr:HAD family hydrolase [Anaerolineae bacterium]HQI86275.1 HAD family hydrolase [Anaerolineae bacterium]
MVTVPEAARPLVDMQPQHDFFIGIDSDGCAFDTMEIKHKECFAPNIIKYWGLQSVSKYAREAAEFVNLYSIWRGVNRWPALIKVFDLLKVRPEVIKRHAAIPEAPHVRAFMNDKNFPQSNDGLKAYKAQYPDPELDKALAWSQGVNAAIADMVYGIPPFPFVRESLEFLCDKADMLVVSQTPDEALHREWAEHGIDKYVRAIAGQEKGTKSQHIAFAAGGKYSPNHVLMIGDALGDLKAARDNNALFFPINPGHEDESWQRFFEEGVHKFLAEEFEGDYEADLVTEFKKFMPEVPPWEK